MSNAFKVMPSKIEDAMELCHTMRGPDVAEIWAVARVTPAQALLKSMRGSGASYTFKVHGKTACMFGVGQSTFVSKKGYPWMLSSDLAFQYPVYMHKYSIKMLEYYKGKFDFLENYIDARNTVAIDWIARLGFFVEKEPVSYGVSKFPFYRFEMRM